jgi:hypothetical protein
MVKLVGEGGDDDDSYTSDRKSIPNYNIKGFNETIAKILLKMLPLVGEEPQKHNIGYFATVFKYHSAYVEEILWWLVDKDLVSTEGEYYYLSKDNIWRLQEFIRCQSSVILAKKLEEIGGG